MAKKEYDPEREAQISDITVDCYSDDEAAMGWYYYLDDHLRFPFKARCIAKRA